VLGCIVLSLLLANCATAAVPGQKPNVLLISGEDEYNSNATLPVFKQFLETNYPLACIYLERKATNDMPGLERLEKADLVILFVRRMTLPDEQLARFKKYVHSGKPLIGLRTASHAFENWKEFDHEVLGGNYQMHHANNLVPAVKINPITAGHPILQGVAAEFAAGGSLYRNTPLGPDTTLLLIGAVAGYPPEPVAWTHTAKGSRVFYTSLGHPKDFENPSFHRLLVNAVFWALNQDPPVARKVASAVPPRKIKVEEFEKLWRDKQNVVLDVRTPREFNAGHIPGAINFDINAPDFDQKVIKLDKDKTYLVHCARGGRSARAVEKLQGMKFKSLYDLTEGFEGWEKKGRPVEKPD
jgi:rhodanese-related sulfurtransferase/type 1 glutamine amidotransferase